MGTNMIIGPCVGSGTQGALLNQNEPEVTAYIDGLTTPLSAKNCDITTYNACIQGWLIIK